MSDDDGTSRRPRVDMRRVNKNSRRRGRAWASLDRRHGTDRMTQGILVTCGRFRICEAGLRPGVPGDLILVGPGNGLASGGKGPRHRAARGRFCVGCQEHGSHDLDLTKVAAQLDLLRPRPGRNWPRVRVSLVEWDHDAS